MERAIHRARLRGLERRCRRELTRAARPHWAGTPLALRRASRRAVHPYRNDARALRQVLRQAAASSVFAFALVASGSAEVRAADFRYVLLDPAGNPFTTVMPTGQGDPEPLLADLDADGDLDLFAGTYLIFQGLTWWENTGTPTAAVFDQPGNRILDLGVLALEYRTSPALADMDTDGDLDTVVSGRNGFTVYGENVGTPQSPTFSFPIGPMFELVPIPGVPLTGYFADPTLGDLDADGDFDLVIGDTYGVLHYAENVGTPQSFTFVERTGAQSPFDGLGIYDIGDTASASPALVDLDQDGDLDLVAGQYYFGRIFYFENVGSASVPSFVERTGAGNPFDGISVGQHAQPSFGDIDGDGDLEMITTGTLEPNYLLYERVDVSRMPIAAPVGWGAVMALIASGWRRLRAGAQVGP